MKKSNLIVICLLIYILWGCGIVHNIKKNYAYATRDKYKCFVDEKHGKVEGGYRMGSHTANYFMKIETVIYGDNLDMLVEYIDKKRFNLKFVRYEQNLSGLYLNVNEKNGEYFYTNISLQIADEETAILNNFIDEPLICKKYD